MVIIAELIHAAANFEAPTAAEQFTATVRLRTETFGIIGRVPVIVQDPLLIQSLRAYVISELPTLSAAAGLPITLIDTPSEPPLDLAGRLVSAAANFDRPRPLPIFEATVQLIHSTLNPLERKVIPVTSAAVTATLRQFVESMLPIASAAVGLTVVMPPPQSEGTLDGEPNANNEGEHHARQVAPLNTPD